jgi:hypothetical protein
MSLTYSGVEPQPSLAWSFESSNVDIVTGLTPSAQVSPGPAQLQGSAALVTDAPTSNTAVSFPGTTSTWMNLGTSTPINFNTSLSNIFMECWVYSSRAYNPNFITWHEGASGGQENWSMFFDTAGTLYTSMWGDVAGTPTRSGTGVGSAIPQNTWTHVGFAIANTASVYKTYIYVNGTPTVNTPPAGWVPKFYAAGITQIGGRNNSSDLTNMYIRDLRVVQGGVVPVANFTPGAAPFSYASPGYVPSMGTTVFTMLGRFITYPSGKFGQGLSTINSLSAVTSYLKYIPSTPINESTGFSISCWVNFLQLPDSGKRMSFVNLSNGTGFGQGVWLSYNRFGTDTFSLYYENTGVGFTVPGYNLTATTGTWYHICGTIGKGSADVYVNGLKGTTLSYSATGTSYSNIYLCCHVNGAPTPYVTSDEMFSGAMDDLRIYNQALTSAQVRSVYSSQGAPAPSRAMPLPKLAWDFNGTTTDYVSGLAPSAGSNVVTNNFSSGLYLQAANVYNTSNAFLGNTLYYNFTSIPVPFSISGWFRLDTNWISSGNPINSYIEVYRSLNAFILRVACFSLSSMQIQFGLYDSGNNLFLINSGHNINLGQWIFFSFTVTPSAATYYIQSASSTTMNTGVIFPSSGQTFNLGIQRINRDGTSGVGQSSLPFNGLVDDLRIFDRALTSAQVQSIYNQQGVPGRGVTSKVVPTFTVSDQSQNPLTLSTYGTVTTDPSSPFGGTEGSFQWTATIPSSVSKMNFNFWSSNSFVEFWWNAPANLPSGYPRVFQRGNYPNEEFSIYQAPNSSSLFFQFSNNSTYTFQSTPNTYQPGIWNHYAVSFNPTNSTLYIGINGTIVYNSVIPLTSIPTYNSSSNWFVCNGSQIPSVNIQISNFRMVTGATTLPYITNGFTVPTAPLSIYPTGTTALLLRSVSPLTMFSGGAIQSATGGNTVQDIGGYRIHTFTTIGTSTFTPSTSGNVEVLVVAGGGGGGRKTNNNNEAAGGGGAGELIYGSSFSISGPINVSIGAGGSGGNSDAISTNGQNSQFGSLLALGGGRGGNGSVGGSGGSGGGGSRFYSGGNATAVTGFGNSGGNSGNTFGLASGGGGGGGAISAGQNSYDASVRTPGGTGYTTLINGTSVVYATGGNGGARSFTSNGADGAANTGNGGDGCDGGVTTVLNGGAGGSGIVIVRYPLPVRLTGTPLFTQLSQAATSSAVGAFSLRAVNGTSARAVQVRIEQPVGAFTVPSGQYGTASSSSSFGGSVPAWKAFNKIFIQNAGDFSQYWASGANYTQGVARTSGTVTVANAVNYYGDWLQIQFPSSFVPVSYSIAPQSQHGGTSSVNTPGTWYFFGSIDGSTWTLLDTRSGIANSALLAGSYTTYNLTGVSTTYSYYRIVCNIVSFNTSFSIDEMVISTVTDFYADRLGNLLTAPVTGQSLANWLGGATGYVTTWYDQSGKGNDAIQTTAANQPIIQRATKGQGYSCLFSGNQRLTGMSYTVLNGTNFSFSVAERRSGVTGGGTSINDVTLLSCGNFGAASRLLYLTYRNNTNCLFGSWSHELYTTITSYNSSNEPIRYTFAQASSTSGRRVNIYNDPRANPIISNNVTQTSLMTMTSGNFEIGFYTFGTNTSYYTGEIYELLVFTQSLYDLDNTGGLITQIYQNQLSAYGT